VSPFTVPALKVGTLDSLMSLSDDMFKFETYVESMAKKIANQLFMLFDPAEHDKLLSINGASPEDYLLHFSWDEAKYPTKASCRELVEMINSQVSKLDEELRAKAGDYGQLAHSLAQSERGTTGNLLSRDLTELIKPADWVETEYLTTVFVVVPKYNLKEFEGCYERFSEFVLPRSAKVIETNDAEFCLIAVQIFKRSIEEFKNAAREKRYSVRDFQYNQENIALGKEEKKKMVTAKEQQKNKLILWCKTNFAEAFIGLIHLKVVKSFVESILRYGLPETYQTALILPNKNDEKKARKILSDVFHHLASKHLESEGEEDTGEAWYPYVSLNITTEMRLQL
jgi:V-type H+-transporting ATPase subunit C